ncbi:hypothetical protein K439DRAFT_921671 [Ramaria rubella]|nr:hypothetical protein K439DRAFT_921671 [Ramaria rubella]
MCKKINGCRVYQSQPFVKARPGRYDVSAGRLSRTTHKLRYVYIGNSLRVGGGEHLRTYQLSGLTDEGTSWCDCYNEVQVAQYDVAKRQY